MAKMLAFIERLEDLMFENAINPSTPAKNVGIDRTTITRYLSGARMPSVKNLLLLSDYFECTTDFLLGFEEENRGGHCKPCPPFSQQPAFLLAYFSITKYQLQKWTKIPEAAIYY